jgi:hypothetical protein
MESGNSGYNLNDLIAQNAVGAIVFDTSQKVSGSGSMKYVYPSGQCNPDANAQANCGGFIDQGFTATTTLYRRVYVRLSAGFIVTDDAYTKLFRSDTTDNLYSNWWTLGCCNSRELNVGNQNVPLGDTTTEFTGFFLADTTWYCIETRETLSTPGVADGILTVWVDGTQVLNKTNIMYRTSGNTFQFNNNRMYRQGGDGAIWFDRLAVGDTRIGCLAGGGGSIVMFITQAVLVTSTFLQVLFIGGYFWERRAGAVRAAVRFWRYAAEVPTPKEMYWAYRYKKAVKHWQRNAPLMLEHHPMMTIEVPKSVRPIGSSDGYYADR